MSNGQKYYLRFSLFQRIEHWLLTLSFTILAVTGLPQRYPLSGWSEWVINAFGGLESIRIIHRISAIVMVILFFIHIIEIGYKMYVRRCHLSMAPGIKDVTDAINYIGHSVGVVKKAPKMPRYNFAEKAEYWALIWGTILMTITGFMLWNPIMTTKILPGEFIPAAKTAHSAEALLAALAILIWHVYWVHIKMFNKAMFTGKLNRTEMAHEHGAELEVIEAGGQPPHKPMSTAESSESQRKRIFTPIAAVVGVAMLAGLYFFTTYESTAIETVPPAEPMEAFVRATPTPTYPPTRTPTPEPTFTLMPTCTPGPGTQGAEEPAIVIEAPEGEVVGPLVPQITHPVKGREDCLMCHGAGKPMAFPENHAAYTLESCTLCHSADAPMPGPKPVLHSIANREDCTQCHQPPDLVPQSHSDAGFTSESCQMCHPAVPSAAPVVSPAAAETQATAKATEAAAEAIAEPEAVTEEPGAPPAISHTLKGREDCLLCHASGKPKAYPEDHAAYTLDTCTACHSAESAAPAAAEPQATAEATEAAVEAEPVKETGGVAPPMPHDLKYKENCILCHAAGKRQAFPEDHASYTVDTCLMCHTQAATETEEAAPVEEQATAEPTAEAEPPAKETGAPPAISHPLKDREDCLLCHAYGKPKSYPKDHTAYKVNSCTACHSAESAAPAAAEPQATAEATEVAAEAEPAKETGGVAPPMPHDLKYKENCILCHITGKRQAFPEDHASYTVDTCLMCHTQAAPKAEETK